MFKSLVFLSFLICFIGFSQSENYSVRNLEMNTEYPHFGLMLINNSKIFYTSYLLDKRDRLKRFQGNPILTIFEGEIVGSGNIENLNHIAIDPDEKITYITSATLSPNGNQLYVTTILNENDISEDNFQLKLSSKEEVLFSYHLRIQRTELFTEKINGTENISIGIASINEANEAYFSTMSSKEYINKRMDKLKAGTDQNPHELAEWWTNFKLVVENN